MDGRSNLTQIKMSAFHIDYEEAGSEENVQGDFYDALEVIATSRGLQALTMGVKQDLNDPSVSVVWETEAAMKKGAAPIATIRESE
jgi:heme-degrading monooxygenase HmoA